MKAFFDSNVLIYALSDDVDKAERAWTVLDKGGVISVQVLNEFVSVSRGKFKIPWPDVETALGGIHRLGLTIASLTPAVQARAVEIARDHHLHIYDATIVASAMDSGCDVLWSEDMSDGHRLDGLTIRNPFRRD